MNKSWNIQVIMFIVFFFVFGTLSAGFADSKKVLLKPQKMILQKTSPSVTKMVKQKVLPDLSVLSIKITPKNPMDSDKITIEAVVHNIGKIATSSSLFKIQIGGKIYPLIKVPGLSIDQKWKYNSKINIKSPGNYRITANINPNKRVAESNFKNNTRIKNFRISKTSPKLRKITPPPSQPPTSGNSPSPTVTPLMEARPAQMSMVSNYHAKFLEFDVRLAPEGYYWEALYKNTGTEGLPNWGYFIRVFQISRDGSEQKAGLDCIMTYVEPGATKKVIDTMAWQKKDDTISLRIEMWRTVHTGNHRFITKKTIPFPLKVVPREMEMHSAAKPLFVNPKIVRHSAVTSGSVAAQEKIELLDVIRGISIKSSEYSGMGNWNVEIENKGNFNINPQELTVTAKYHTNESTLPVSQPFQNNTIIPPGQTGIIRGYGLSNEVSCQQFWCIDLLVYYTAMDKTYYEVIDTPNVLSATIDEVKLERSALSYRLKNMSPYPINVTVELEEIEIWDGPKPQNDDSSWYEDFRDIFTNGFDTSGLQPEEMKCRAENIVLRSYTLNAGKTLYSMLYRTTINDRLRAQCPGVNFSDYAYLFKNLKIKLYITANGENFGNAIGFDNCTSGRTLDQKTISEGGSQDIPAFSW